MSFGQEIDYENSEKELERMTDEYIKEQQELNKAKGIITEEESEEQASAMFGDDGSVVIDGKAYKIAPLTLRDARWFMNKIRVLNIDNIVFNFIEEESSEAFIEAMLLGFRLYPEVDREFIETKVDVSMGSKILLTMMAVNGLKK